MSLKDKFIQKQNPFYCVFCLESCPLSCYFPFFWKKVCKVGVWFLQSEAKVQTAPPLSIQRLGKCFRQERGHKSQLQGQFSQNIFILVSYMFILEWHINLVICQSATNLLLHVTDTVLTVSNFICLILPCFKTTI